MPEEPQVEVVDNPAEHRFEITFDGALAGFTVYEERADAWAFVHTEIDPSYGGHGLGSRLVGAAMEAMAERGTTVLPYCPFVKAWTDKHPGVVTVGPLT